jgi:hypothetical protein
MSFDLEVKQLQQEFRHWENKLLLTSYSAPREDARNVCINIAARHILLKRARKHLCFHDTEGFLKRAMRKFGMEPCGWFYCEPYPRSPMPDDFKVVWDDLLQRFPSFVFLGDAEYRRSN